MGLKKVRIGTDVIVEVRCSVSGKPVTWSEADIRHVFAFSDVQGQPVAEMAYKADGQALRCTYAAKDQNYTGAFRVVVEFSDGVSLASSLDIPAFEIVRTTGEADEDVGEVVLDIDGTMRFYSLSEAISKIEGATSDAQTAAALATAAAKNADASAEKADRAAESAAETDKTIQADEEARKAAETSRAEAESSRVSAESGRVKNEDARGTAETAREEAETSRGDAEKIRENAEMERKTAESERNKAEIARSDAEMERKSSEQERSEAEFNRASEFALLAAGSKTATANAQAAADRAENATIVTGIDIDGERGVITITAELGNN